MRILLITRYFPPDSAIGGVRPYQFAKLLREYGIETWVLTVEEQFAERIDAWSAPEGISPERILRTAVQPSLMDILIRQGVRLKKLLRGTEHSAPGAASPENADNAVQKPQWELESSPLVPWLQYPDTQRGWLPPAISAADELLRRMRFDVVISTSPPRTAHFIASRVAQNHRLPWVMDMRDPFYGEWESESHPAPLTILYARLFRRLAGQAAAVVANTDRLRQHLCVSFPELAAKTVTIYNGCADQRRLDDAHKVIPQFRVGHYGNLYGQRTAAMFVQGLQQWLDSKRTAAAAPLVNFYGSEFDSATVRAVETSGLELLVRFRPAVPRQDALRLMREDYILLLVANSQPYQIPGKVFEYLSAGRRILALTERDSATADLLKGHPNCYIAQSLEEVVEAINECRKDFDRGQPAEVDHSGLLAACSYERRAAEMAELLGEVTKEARLPRRDRATKILKSRST